MNYYIQADENGRSLSYAYGEKTPIHPRQLIVSELPDLTGKRMDLKTMELVDDEEYHAEQEKRADIENHIRKLVDERLAEEKFLKPDNWDDLSVQEKAEIHLNETQ